MASQKVDAIYLDATTSLRYFTGLYCYPSERLHGAIISADQLFYVCPAFEKEKRILMVMCALIGLGLGVHLFVTGTWTAKSLLKDIEIWVAEAA